MDYGNLINFDWINAGDSVLAISSAIQSIKCPSLA